MDTNFTCPVLSCSMPQYAVARCCCEAELSCQPVAMHGSNPLRQLHASVRAAHTTMCCGR
eukprot:362836-Chlamydomonas_euryale.AAC.16